MKSLASFVRRFLTSQDGPTVLEYAVILALIALVCLAAITAIGRNADSAFHSVANQIDSGSEFGSDFNDAEPDFMEAPPNWDESTDYDLREPEWDPSPRNDLRAFLDIVLPFVWWGIAVFLARSHAIPGKRPLVAGFALLGVHAAMVRMPLDVFYQAGFDPHPPIFFLAVGLLLVGAWKAGSRHSGAGAAQPHVVNQYYSTDELIARNATFSTVNEEIESLKQRWREELEQFVQHDPTHTAIIDPGKFGRKLILQRYSKMGGFDSAACGQLRSVEVTIAGPGDPLTWMTVTAKYFVDETPVGERVIHNHWMRSGPNLQIGRESSRIRTFLTRGRFRLDFYERFVDPALTLAKHLVLLPVQIAGLGAGLIVAVVRNIVRWGRVKTRFAVSKRPDTLPPEQSGAPLGYWYVVLDGLGEKKEELKSAITNALERKKSFGLTLYDKEVVQWGGFAIKEQRVQTIVELRRGKVVVSVHDYGPDLYIRWDSHINYNTWLLRRFAHGSCVGYHFKHHAFAWLRPLYTEVPSVYEYAPYVTPITDYDWADLDALEAVVHEATKREVKAFAERHGVQQEIDYEMKKGLGGEQLTQPDAQQPTQQRTRGPMAWASKFRRRQ